MGGIWKRKEEKKGFERKKKRGGGGEFERGENEVGKIVKSSRKKKKQ